MVVFIGGEDYSVHKHFFKKTLLEARSQRALRLIDSSRVACLNINKKTRQPLEHPSAKRDATKNFVVASCFEEQNMNV